MDRKQREDAINEVSRLMSYMLVGPRLKSNETPLHYYLQRILYGQEMPVHCHGLC